MDNLIAKAGTSVPRSMRGPVPSGTKRHTHITNKKLRATLDRQSAQAARAKQLAADAALLASNDAGTLQVEGELERTWRVSQDEITKAVGAEAAKGRRELSLDGGPYRMRYTRNGRHMAVVGNRGHVATFDWQTGAMHSELQLAETCRDITFLQDHMMYAVAQKKSVFIYDRDGVELHRLKSHVEPTRLEFLPFHWLLASVGLTGYLKYQDTSTGQVIAEHRTKLGPCSVLAQNTHNAVLHAGHANGQVTLWTPNMPEPAVRLLSHLGPVQSVALDQSSAGRYMATSGADGRVKVWDCRNWKGAVREWSARGGPAELEWSQRGMLAVASGGTVNVHHRPAIVQPFAPHVAPPLYLTHPVPHRPLQGLRFCPFSDVLSIGHGKGISSILVPGAGEPNFDSLEADPFENKKARREREVRGLLDKIQPDAIALDPEFIGGLATQPRVEADIPFARLPRLARLEVGGKADTTEAQSDSDADMDGAEGEGADGVSAGAGRKLTKEEREKRKEEKEKKRMRGRNKATKRFLRKQRKNVIDPKAVAIREKFAKEREARQRARGDAAPAKYAPSVLDRFKRSS